MIPVCKHPYLFISLLLVVVLLMISLFLPMFTLTKLLVFDNTFSVASGIVGLVKNQQYILFLVLLVFTIILPLVKIGGLFASLFQYSVIANSTIVKISLWLGKWSMLDVFAVSILLMSVKLGAVANIDIHVGFYVFTISVLGLTFLTYLIQKYTKNSAVKEKIYNE